MIIDSNLDHIFHRILEFLIPNGLNFEWKRLMKKKEKKNSQAHVNEWVSTCMSVCNGVCNLCTYGA